MPRLEGLIGNETLLARSSGLYQRRILAMHDCPFSWQFFCPFVGFINEAGNGTGRDPVRRVEGVATLILAVGIVFVAREKLVREVEA